MLVKNNDPQTHIQNQASSLTQGIDRQTFINAMRDLASSVTVVTTQGEDGQYGATASSFTSVSADPPSVLICLNNDSTITQQVSKNKRFCINLLSHSAQHLSNVFAGRYDDTTQSVDRFANVDIHAHDTGPILAGCTAFCCALSQSVVAGSHLVFIGTVLEIHGATDKPLIYYDGNYHHLGEVNMGLTTS